MIPSISQIQGIFSGWFIVFLFQLSRWLSLFVSRVNVSITAVGCTEYYNLNWTYKEWMKVLPSLKMVVALLRKTRDVEEANVVQGQHLLYWLLPSQWDKQRNRVLQYSQLCQLWLLLNTCTHLSLHFSVPSTNFTLVFYPESYTGPLTSVSVKSHIAP